MRQFLLPALLLIGPLVPAGAAGQGPILLRENVPAASVPRTSAEVSIDGVLDEPVWREALQISLDIEVDPGENEAAPVTTTAYLIENGRELLVAFDARDPSPEQIRAFLRDRDNGYDDDWVGIELDTFNDERRSFGFAVNALGVQMDATSNEIGGGFNDSWNAIWDSAGRITATGYIVEIAIPYSQLRFQRTAEPQNWGVDLTRNYPRDNRVQLAATPRDRNRNCSLCQLGEIRGFANAEPGRGIEVVPALTTNRTDRLDYGTGALIRGDSNSDAGVNVRWSVTPDVVANLALNPDFSQVEADVPQLEINNQFTLRYAETRPFFLEGGDFFNTPINALFTRTVADPDIGAKITGTLGETNFGVFAAEDTVTNLIFPGSLGSSSTSLAQSNTAIAGRYQYSFGNNSSVGTLLTSRSGSAYRNTLVGFDGRFRPSDQHTIQVQHLESDTAYPDELASARNQPLGSFTGSATRMSYDYNSRNWRGEANFTSFDDTFRADMGFITQVNVQSRSVGGARTWYGTRDTWWNRVQVQAFISDEHDQSGLLLETNRSYRVNMQGPLQMFALANISFSEQYYGGELYNKKTLFLLTSISPVRGLSLNIRVNRGDQVDFTNARLGFRKQIGGSLEWNANRHLLLRLDHTVQNFDTQAGAKIFDVDLTDLRLTWQFNVRAFLRLTTQQQDVSRNLAEYSPGAVDERSVRRGFQLLYSYKLNPQTVAFAGYSDNHIENDDFQSLIRTDRTVFLKLSYAWTP